MSTRTETALKTGVPCPLCGRSLIPILVDQSVTLHCGNGHELHLKDLLRSPSLALLNCLETLMMTWNRELRRLGVALEDARKHGYLEVAVLYHRQMRGIVERSELLRTALASTYSATVVPPNVAEPGGPGIAAAPPRGPSPREAQPEGRGSGL